jgi:hypothetical protein
MRDTVTFPHLFCRIPQNTVAEIFVLGHIHTFYVHDFQRLSDERRKKRRQERVLDEAIEKIGEELKLFHL